MLNLDSGYFQEPKSQLDFIKDNFKEDYLLKIPVYSEPIYPFCQESVRDYNFRATRKLWEPLFLENGVKFVFEGSSGGYKITKKLKEEKEDKDGIIYVGEGKLGKIDKLCNVKKNHLLPEEIFDKTGDQTHFWILHLSKKLVYAFSTDGTRTFDNVILKSP